jgi:tripartite-type tricarboxylate transporter receptor subunit TctC
MSSRERATSATACRALMLTAAMWLACIATAAAAASAPAWKPDKAVELIVINAPGGGSDRIARMMTSIMQERRLLDTPINVVNKPGGGGAIAYAYLNQHPGDAQHMSNWRTIIGPRGLSAAQVAYWEDALRRTIETDAWKKELEANLWLSDFVPGVEARKLMERDTAELRSFLGDLGLVKQ